MQEKQSKFETVGDCDYDPGVMTVFWFIRGCIDIGSLCRALELKSVVLCPTTQGSDCDSDPGFVSVIHATQVASLVGVTEGNIGQRCRGGGAQSDTSAKHARFAAACALNALLCEQSVVVVEQQWGLPSTVTQQGR